MNYFECVYYKCGLCKIVNAICDKKMCVAWYNCDMCKNKERCHFTDSLERRCDMERLTEKFDDGEVFCGKIGAVEDIGIDETIFVGELVDKLAEYEQAEEDGLLIRPFCKIGDEVYEINPLTNRITNRIIKSIVICNAPDLTIMYKSGYDYSILHEDFGKTVFRTEAEAEQVLAKMKGE